MGAMDEIKCTGCSDELGLYYPTGKYRRNVYCDDCYEGLQEELDECESTKADAEEIEEEKQEIEDEKEVLEAELEQREDEEIEEADEEDELEEPIPAE